MLFGTGTVSRGLAERLGVPLLDRKLRDGAARRSRLPKDAIDDIDEEPQTRLERLFSNLGRASTPTTSPVSSRPIVLRTGLRAPPQPTTYRARMLPASPSVTATGWSGTSSTTTPVTWSP